MKTFPIRLVHAYGGSERIEQAYVSGTRMFVIFGQLAGTYEVDPKTGGLKSRKRNLWNVHPEHLKLYCPRSSNGWIPNVTTNRKAK